MNQTNSRELNLSAAEARQLQADIFDLLLQIAELTKVKKDEVADTQITVDFDGGNF